MFYGLVCGGVVLDYQKIKSVIKVYDKIVFNEGFWFFGNVWIGFDLIIDELKIHYDQIILVMGNELDCKMGMLGEELNGVYSVIEFVGWYNGYLDFMDWVFVLVEFKCVVVVGNGNVVMDVVCVLVCNLDDLVVIDIVDYVLDMLWGSMVEDILLFGRCGFVQVAFLLFEMKEFGSLELVDVVIILEIMELGEVIENWLVN